MTEYTEFPGTPAPKPRPKGQKDGKPWFYNDPDKYDDKFALLVGWVLGLVSATLIIAGVFAGHGRWVWAGIVCSFMQYLLVKSQVPSGERYYEHDEPTHQP